MCGENSSNHSRSPRVMGSSPRVRGKPDFETSPAYDARLIPACAGKTIAGFDESEVGRAHPRVCGENQDTNVLDLTGAGSSPRVRGKLRAVISSPSAVWLIPACAGKTHLEAEPLAVPEAHPRVCGENIISVANPLMQLGSSPRVRGKRKAAKDFNSRGGLIPACAGKTLGSRRAITR